MKTLWHVVPLRAIVVGGALMAGVSFAAFCYFGSARRALAALGGEDVIIESISHPDTDATGVRTLSIVVSSLSNESTTILGAESGCGCIAFRDLPVTIPPLGQQKVQAAHESQVNGSASSKVILYTTSKVNPRLVAIVPPL